MELNLMRMTDAAFTAYLHRMQWGEDTTEDKVILTQTMIFLARAAFPRLAAEYQVRFGRLLKYLEKAGWEVSGE